MIWRKIRNYVQIIFFFNDTSFKNVLVVAWTKNESPLFPTNTTNSPRQQNHHNLPCSSFTNLGVYTGAKNLIIVSLSRFFSCIHIYFFDRSSIYIWSYMYSMYVLQLKFTSRSLYNFFIVNFVHLSFVLVSDFSQQKKKLWQKCVQIENQQSNSINYQRRMACSGIDWYIEIMARSKTNLCLSIEEIHRHLLVLIFVLR